jgi:hypothetical protein
MRDTEKPCRKQLEDNTKQCGLQHSFVARGKVLGGGEKLPFERGALCIPLACPLAPSLAIACRSEFLSQLVGLACRNYCPLYCLCLEQCRAHKGCSINSY